MTDETMTDETMTPDAPTAEAAAIDPRDAALAQAEALKADLAALGRDTTAIDGVIARLNEPPPPPPHPLAVELGKHAEAIKAEFGLSIAIRHALHHIAVAITHIEQHVKDAL